MMITPAGVKVHLALGITDMRKGMEGLAALVQQTLKLDPFCGHLFCFRGRRANVVKILFWDGSGVCLYTKRLDSGIFAWPMLGEPGTAVALSSGQLALLLEGIDWVRRYKPAGDRG